MNRWRACILAVLVGAAPLWAQDALPSRSPGDTFDFEPKLMLDGPGVAVPDSTPVPATPEAHVKQLEAALLRAEQRAAGSDQLYKDGILAKVEVEARELRVIQLTNELAGARADAAAARADAVKLAFDARKATQADLDNADAALATARQSAQSARAEWSKAQLNAATLDLERKRKLFAEGVATTRELQLAEERLAQLTGTAHK